MSAQRNLVIVLGHGLRSDALGDSEAWPLHTPGFEKLASRGVRMIATSACPADPGGMVSLLTGLHARQHGYLRQGDGPAGCVGWAAALADVGYHMVGVGRANLIQRWLTEAIPVADVDELEPAECAYMDAMRKKQLDKAVTQQRRQRKRTGPFEPDRLALDPDDDVDGFIAVQARQALEQMPSDRPWALVVIFTGPGNELPPPAPYNELVEPNVLELGFIPADLRQVDALAELDYPRVMLQRLGPNQAGQIRSDYLGRVGLIDHGVGRLMSMLEERADKDRTWFVVGSDRGCLLGEHGLIGHRSFLAPAIETPAIITPPTPASVDRSEDLISTVDVAATIAILAGADLPAGVVGRSLLPLLAGQPLTPRIAGGALPCEYGRRLLLESERHKAVFDPNTRQTIGLFDLLKDPDEKSNLIDTSEGQNILDTMRWRLGDTLLSLRAPGGDL